MNKAVFRQSLVDQIDALEPHLEAARDAALILLDAESSFEDRDAAREELAMECGDAMVEVAKLLPLLDRGRNG